MAIGVLSILVYTLWGGMWSVAVTDFLQMIILVVGLLVLAAAGSGKTRVITRRIARLIGLGVRPWSILAVTFTNKAAGEMRERVEKILGPEASGVFVSTFHSACVRILRREAEQFGFTKSFTIYDSGDSRALIKRLVKEHEAAVEEFGLTTHQGTLESAAEKIKLTRIKIEAYASYLDDRKDMLLASVDQANAKLKEHIADLTGNHRVKIGQPVA